MKKQVSKATVNVRHQSVWDAIESNPAKADEMKLRSALLSRVKDYIQRARLTDAAACEQLSITQQRLSDLRAGKIDSFELQALIDMAIRAGLDTP